MKNSATFEIKDINVVIEGQPVNIQGCTIHYENEASVQELATSASFVKDLIGEIKDVIKEAQASAQQTYNCSITDTSEPIADIKAQSKKVSQKWDLPVVWKTMMRTLPSGFDKNGAGVYTYVHEHENKDNGKREKTTIKLSFKEETIDMRVSFNDTIVYFYLYEEGERSWVNGINPTIVDELIDELPEDVKEFVRNFVKKVLNK